MRCIEVVRYCSIYSVSLLPACMRVRKRRLSRYTTTPTTTATPIAVPLKIAAVLTLCPLLLPDAFFAVTIDASVQFAPYHPGMHTH